MIGLQAPPPLASAADGFTAVANWWREAKGWTLMYHGGLTVAAGGAVLLVLWRVVAAKRERARLEALVASRTRQLRQSEELFRSIFEHATAGIFQSSLDGRNLHANPAMAHICGYADPETMRRELRDVATQFYVQPGRREEINAAVACEGSAVDRESEIHRRDGSRIWISESVRTVIDPASGQTVYQGSIIDITARREMQAAQEQARAAAEAANAAKGAFLSHMTHELRTPLTGILSNARVALRDPALDEANRARYALIVSSGEHLLALIDEVLDLSRIEAGRMELRVGPFRVGELLRLVAGAFQARAAEKRSAFRWVVDPLLPPTVVGDALRLRQVLDNLLGNAFKFTTQGSVMLGVRRGGSETNIHFEVVDTGIGIPADQIEVIFEPFRQAMHPDHLDRPGAGLGLHISARLVALMGGQLRAESTPGRGSRFHFELPLPAADHGAALRPLETTTPFPAGPALTAPSTPFAVPPKPEIEALLTLSLQGDIVRLRARLKELAAGDPALGEFAQAVDSLAAGFHMDAIGEFLSRVRRRGEEEPPPASP